LAVLAVVACRALGGTSRLRGLAVQRPAVIGLKQQQVALDW